MNIQEQVNHFKQFTTRQEEILFKKGNDYASDDRLSNFKVAGSICQLTPAQQCLSLIATKVARLGVLLQGKTPNNESIRDSVIDLANYTVLLDQLLSELETKRTDGISKNEIFELLTGGSVFDILLKVNFIDEDGDIDVYNIPDCVSNWPMTESDDLSDVEEYVDLENWSILEISEHRLTMSAGGDWQKPITFTMTPVNGQLKVIECKDGYDSNGLTERDILNKFPQ